MKNIKYIVGLGLLTLGSMTACDDVLDKAPLDRFTNDNFWKTEGNVENYANTFYANFTGYGNAGGSGLFYFKTLSDDQVGNSFSDWGQKTSLTNNSTWSSCYTEIRRANAMIEKIPEIDASEAAKNHWLGVGRMMRAYNYFQLVRMFGDVTYTEAKLDVVDEDVIYGSRNNRDEVMDKVLEDLNFAAANINENYSTIKWNRAMANAMKADICLWEGTFRKYRSSADGQPAADASGAQKFLQACKEACQYVMGREYFLSDSYQALYNSTTLTDNYEVIFGKEYKENVLMHSLIAYTCSSTQMSGMSKDAFESYLMADGKPMGLSSLDETDVAPMNEDGKLDLTDILAVRDKRLSETIDHVLLYNGNSNTRVTGDMEQTSSSGYGVAKYDNTTLPQGSRRNTTKNYTCAPVFWLAVVYLNYAEACAELGTISQTDLDNTINKLRDRAGLPHLTTEVGFTDPKNDRGVSDLIWEIRRERRSELMFDNWFRYWDLVRWHMLDKLDSTKYPDVLLGANVKNDPACEADKKGDYIDGSKGMTRTFENKYYLYPIPSGQTDLNPQLGQNPGW